jgi:multidrug efflux system outer membrane protein
MKHVICVAALAASSLLLCACAGFPSKPAPASLPAALPLDAPATAGGAWPAAEWWRRYQDPNLDRLIELALDSSPTLATAHARFDSAREFVRVAGSETGAKVGLAGDASRQRLSDNGLFPPQLLGFHWYNQIDLGLQASYTFDWWGKQKATIAAALDQAKAAQADRSAAALVLASSVADTYFGWQADQARLAIARERLAVIEREGELTGLRIRAELDAGDSVHRSDSQLAAQREQLARLEGSARLRIVTLAALTGRAAADLPALVAKPLPVVAAKLPDNVRIDLIARRADIAASRWRIEAAERNLDSARAEFFPDISVNALAGLGSIEFSRLIEYGSRVPQIGAAVHLPIFDAGRLQARYGASKVQIESAVAAYDQTLVDAARDVATQIVNLDQVAAERTQREIESDAALRLQASAQARQHQGLTDGRAVLAATEAALEQRDALAQLDSAALSADIALQRALGGGYESPPQFVHTDSNAPKATP